MGRVLNSGFPTGGFESLIQIMGMTVGTFIMMGTYDKIPL
jgi:hypothetical protein